MADTGKTVFETVSRNLFRHKGQVLLDKGQHAKLVAVQAG